MLTLQHAYRTWRTQIPTINYTHNFTHIQTHTHTYTCYIHTQHQNSNIMVRKMTHKKINAITHNKTQTQILIHGYENTHQNEI